MENQINIKKAWESVWAGKKLFYWIWPITFVLSVVILFFCIPSYYTCRVVLTPETKDASAGGMLSSLGASFGLDLGSVSAQEAIYPILYPDVVNSHDFLIGLFDVQLKTSEGDFEGRCYDYWQKFFIRPFWEKWKGKLIHMISFGEARQNGGDPNAKPGDKLNPFWMNKSQLGVISLMQKHIVCTVDKKTEVISLAVTAQDKLVCATLAEAVCEHLQDFITEYHTQKSKQDTTYYGVMIRNAQANYQNASKNYSQYCDSHSGLALERYKIEAQRLEDEMEMHKATYIGFQKQMIAAKAKLQEDTPAFTIITSATVPPKPAGPHRIRTILLLLILATGGGMVWLARKDLFPNLF